MTSFRSRLKALPQALRSPRAPCVPWLTGASARSRSITHFTRLTLATLLAASALPAMAVLPNKPPAPEVEVTARYIIDFEFDWGRDGVDCPDCNQGAGNSRLSYTDLNQRLWVGAVEFKTGNFIPMDGKGTQVDTRSAFATDFGNGPEWMFSALGSQLAYTRYLDDLPSSPETARIAVATQVAGGNWVPAMLPGDQKRQSPIGTTDLGDPFPRMQYQDVDKKFTYWRDTGTDAAEHTLPTTGFSGGSRRWVPGTRKIILTADGLEGDGVGHKQVFLYDTDDGSLKQITSEPHEHAGAMMWRAPEFNNDWVFFCVRDGGELVVYRNLKGPDGQKQWTPTIELPMPPETPHLWSPEYFIHNGQSYIFFQMNESFNAADLSKPGVLAMTPIVPKKARLIPLTPPDAGPAVRMDPEYFITAKGPYIYYNRYKLATDTEKAVYQGVYRVDTHLGKPKGVTQTTPEAVGELRRR